MLDSKQKSMIKELFGSGVNISEIARRVGVSRQSVYRVLDTDVDRDPDIIQLRKDLEVAELTKKIRELRPKEEYVPESVSIKSAMDNLCSLVLTLWDYSRDVKNITHYCIYCGGKMQRGEKESPSGDVFPAYRCRDCDKVFCLI